jgi:hypothetical protein
MRRRRQRDWRRMKECQLAELQFFGRTGTSGSRKKYCRRMRRSRDRGFAAQAEGMSYILVNSLSLERRDALLAYLRGRVMEDVERGPDFFVCTVVEWPP